MEKRELIKFLSGKPKSLDEISKQFKLRQSLCKEELQIYLDSGLIVDSINGYALAKEYGLILATIVLRKEKFAYVKPVDESYKNDYRVAGSSLKGYILNDVVYISLDNWDNATIAGLYKRTPSLIGNIFKAPTKGYLLKCNLLENTDIKVNIVTDLSSKEIGEGDLVKCNIVKSSVGQIDVEFDKTLVKANQVGADISSIIVSNDAPLVFDSEVLVQAKMMEKEVTKEDKEGREDFTNETIVTIDGEDALDFDDAISVKEINNGYEIGVYIADVSYYVQPNSPIDKEASKRGTSIYVADRVVPMLPFELSNGICSLNPNVERLVLACIMQVNNDGNVYRSRIVPGVIKSKARLTYTQVNNYFEKGETSDLPENILKMLDVALKAGNIIRKRRERHGALDLESVELKFHLDENGKPIEILKKSQGIGEKLIEDLMIITNCEVAKTISNLDIPTLYRVHDNPPEDKLANFKAFLKNIKLYKNFPAKITSSSLSNWFNSIEDKDTKFAVSNFLLRALAKAKYSPINSGHFGLAEEYYLHFTSPIRRYPDLLVHRTIRDYIFLKKKFDYSSYMTYMTNMGVSTSASERRATTIEREVDDLEACKYMEDKIGEEFDGLITNITPKGMYLLLDNGVDSYLDINTINPTKKYFYSNAHMDIQSKKDEFRHDDGMELYKLGDHIKVVVYKVTFEDKTVHVITQACKQYFDNIKEYDIQMEEDKKELSSRKDDSRFKSRKEGKKTIGRRTASYNKKQNSFEDEFDSKKNDKKSYSKKKFDKKVDDKSRGEKYFKDKKDDFKGDRKDFKSSKRDNKSKSFKGKSRNNGFKNDRKSSSKGFKKSSSRVGRRSGHGR